MTAQMPFDLALGFRDKPKAARIAQTRGDRTQRIRAGVPQRIEQADVRTELTQALGSPGQVILFFPARFGKLLLDRLTLREASLGVIQRLRTDLTDMVDPH